MGRHPTKQLPPKHSGVNKPPTNQRLEYSNPESHSSNIKKNSAFPYAAISPWAASHPNSEVKHGRARVALRGGGSTAVGDRSTAVGDHAGRPGAAYFALSPFACLPLAWLGLLLTVSPFACLPLAWLGLLLTAEGGS